MPKPENCETCGLFETARTYKIGYSGAKHPDILFIGEAPGRYEDIKGEPFVGDSGKILRRLIEQAGFKKLGFKFGFTNAVRCRPPENATPSKKIINLCKPFLLEDISRLDPKILVPLGNVPLQALLGKTGITKARGMLSWWTHPTTGETYGVFPTFHPSYLKRNPSMESFVELDFKTIISILVDPPTQKTTYCLVQDEKELRRLKKQLKSAKYVAFDIESSTLRYPSDGSDILMASVAVKPTKSHVLLLSDRYRVVSKALRKKARQTVVDLFLDPKKTIVGANLAFDIGYVYHKYGVLPRCKVADVQIYHYLAISEEGRAMNLKKMALAYTDLGDYDAKLNKYFEKHQLKSYADIPLEMLWPYCATDGDATIRLFNMLKPKIDKEYSFIASWLNRGVVALAKARVDGMKIDEQLYYKMRDNFDSYLTNLKNQILEREDVQKAEQLLELKPKERFNPKSSKQMNVLVYKVQGFPVQVYTEKGNPSVNAKALELCRKTKVTKKSKYFHKTLDLIQEYITHRTLHDMFIKPMPSNVDKDFFIHPVFGLIFTVTGRLNCTDPNVQQIPAARGVDPDFYIKKLFVSRFPGGQIAVADYSQMELRILAMVSKDPVLLDAFRSGKDIHQQTSDRIFGPGDPDGSKRKAAKIVNFGVIYGEQAPSLASQIGCSVRKAQKILDGYWSTYKKVKTLFFQNERFLLRNGYVVSLFGRKRRFGLNFDDKYYMSRIKRQANNVIIQGPASDINLFAFILLSEIIRKHDLQSVVCGLIHDSVIVDVHPDEVEVMQKLIPYIMEVAVVRDVLQKFAGKIELVPLKVDLSMGPNWAEQKPVER